MNDGTKITVDFSSKVNGSKEVEKYAESLQKVYSLLSGIENGQNKVFGELKKNTNQLNKNLDVTAKNNKRMSDQFNIMFNYKILNTYVRSLKNFVSTMASFVTKSSSYIENVNLLEVAYYNANEEIEESSKRIEDFIQKMADVYGLDESRLTRQFGIFKQLANAMQLPTETAEHLSELMVKMSNDIASLYNLDLDRASNALQSALAGQVRPIRTATGADITEKTLQQTVDRLGLDRTINQLSYVEKRLVMVISLTEQLKKSQGDWARTIESVANQTRIMKEQWQRLSRAIGNVFYPILEKVLPYLNAILMVLTEIFNLIASLMGYEMPKFDYSGLAGASDAVSDLIEGMDGASASADKLKDKMNGLRGFDKLNVISTPKDNEDGAGAGIDPAILDAFNASFGEYDDKLEEVNMKAREIAQKMLEWLGFTDGTYKNLKLIGIILGTFAGLKIFDILYGLFSGNSILGKLLRKGTIYKTITNIVKKFNEFNILAKIFSPTGLLVGGILALAGALVYAYKNNDEFKKSVDDFVKVLIDTAKPIIEDLLDILKMLWEDVLKPLWENAIKPIAKILVETLVPTLTVLMSILKPIIKDILGPVLELLIKLVEFALKPITTIIRIILEVIGGILETGQKIWEFLKPFFEFVVTTIENAIKPAIESIGGVIKTIKDAIQEVVDWWNGLSFNKKTVNVEWEASERGNKSSLLGIEARQRKANGGIFANGQWHDITAYAGGGLPPVGQMFIAREKGAELVGNINGNTAVMNNDQIVASVSEGVYKAVSMANKQQTQPIDVTIPVQVGEERIATIVINDLQNMAKTNGKPIVIGG